jgi:hypothetical protein
MEAAETDHEPAVWRGHVTKLPDGVPRYVDDLYGVCDLMVAWLQELGLDA